MGGRVLILLAASLASGCGWAGAYKCIHQGRVSYQDRPCVTGGVVELGPNSLPPDVADRDAAERRRQSDVASAGVLRQADARREAQAQERLRSEAEKAASDSRQLHAACQAEKVRLKSLEKRLSADWQARDAVVKQLKEHYRKCR